MNTNMNMNGRSLSRFKRNAEEKIRIKNSLANSTLAKIINPNSFDDLYEVFGQCKKGFDGMDQTCETDAILSSWNSMRRVFKNQPLSCPNEPGNSMENLINGQMR